MPMEPSAVPGRDKVLPDGFSQNPDQLPRFEREAELLPRRYTEAVQLHIARLCLDCDEIHAAQTCPNCLSESFAYINRWIPAPDRPARARPVVTSPTADTYRELLAPDQTRSGPARWLRRGVFGVAAVSVAGWLWRRKIAGAPPNAPPKT